MTKEGLSAILRSEIIGREVRVYPEMPSTNDLAMELGRAGQEEGLVIFANHQTQGRGRLGRKWHTTGERSLAFSILLRPSFTNVGRLSLAAAVAVARALEKLDILAVGIKWPNDVQICGKKIAGILCESGAGFIVIGIGVNVLQDDTDFSGELEGLAASVAMFSQKTPDPNQIAADILQEMDTLYQCLPAAFSRVIAECERRSVLLGQSVEITRDGATLGGVVTGLDASGALKIRAADGEDQLIYAGEVTLLRRHLV